MGVHVEWMDARATSAQYARAGVEFGDATVDPGKYALVLSADDLFVIEGTVAELRQLQARIDSAVTKLEDDAMKRTKPEIVIVPEPRVLVRTHSHRARYKLERLLGYRPAAYYTMAAGGVYVYVPEELAPDVTAITGITRARPKGHLGRCIE